MTKKHNRYILVFFTATLLFFLSTGFSYALEITNYPNIPFAPTITQNSQLPDFIAYFFGLGIYLAGALAVISLAIGGIQLIFSSVSPEARNDAIDRIKGAILGLVLTISSIIILRTINPVLVTPTLTPLVAGAGIFYTNSTDEKPAPDAESDTSTIPLGFETIIYKCSVNGGGTGPVLLVQKFPQTNFRGYRTTYTKRLNCGESTPLDALSFKTSFETPGVYYFLKTGCGGYMSQASLSNTQEIEEPFKSEAKSVLIINDIHNNINYGVILHKEINFRGDCSWPFESYQRERFCYNIPSDSSLSSINIFALNRYSPETSGNGVVFYSKPFGYKTGANAGYFKLSNEYIGEFWRARPGVIDFNYTGVNVPEDEKDFCKTFENCPGSIKVQGNYLAVLYAQQLQNQNLYCQVFDKDVPNLKEEEVIAVEGRQLDTIFIIPIK